MKNFHIYLFLSGLFYLFQFFSARYIYQEIDGFSLSHDQLVFSVFLKNFDGLLLYCIDSSNKLLMELSTVQSEKILIVKYNNFADTFIIADLKLGLCFNQSNVYFTVLLQLKNTNIIIECKNETRILKLNQKIYSDQFNAYPRPKHDFNLMNKMFIWMGNCGTYIGLDDQVYHPLKMQLSGCVDQFRINEEIIDFPKNQSNFTYSCYENYIENRCKQKCSTIITSYKIYDCSPLSLNLKHCVIELINYSNIEKTYKNLRKNQKIDYFRVDWRSRKSSDVRNYCLMEIKIGSQGYLLFYVDQDNSIIMTLRNLVKKYSQIFKVKTDPISTNVLLIYLNKSEITIKIYNGNEIYSFTNMTFYEFELINIGFFQHRNLYKTFQGEINFKYDTNFWTSMSNVNEFTDTIHSIIQQPKQNKQKMNKIIIIVLVIILILVVIIIFIVIFLIIRMKDKSKKYKNPTANRSKSPSPNHYDLEMNDIHSVENLELEYETHSNNDDEEYERIPEKREL